MKAPGYMVGEPVIDAHYESAPIGDGITAKFLVNRIGIAENLSIVSVNSNYKDYESKQLPLANFVYRSYALHRINVCLPNSAGSQRSLGCRNV
jgi:hypothetical protein